jgi:hypothetical protein
MGYWALVEPFWARVNIYDGPKAFQRSFSGLPPAIRTLVAAHWCESEVSNGGLHQFFSNPTGVLAPEAKAAFKDLGVLDLADILSEAMTHLGRPYPRHLSRRNARLARLQAEAVFEPLDRRFYEVSGVASRDPSTARLWVAMDRYAEQRGETRAGRRTMR